MKAGWNHWQWRPTKKKKSRTLNYYDMRKIGINFAWFIQEKKIIAYIYSCDTRKWNCNDIQSKPNKKVNAKRYTRSTKSSNNKSRKIFDFLNKNHKIPKILLLNKEKKIAFSTILKLDVSTLVLPQCISSINYPKDDLSWTKSNPTNPNPIHLRISVY